MRNTRSRERQQWLQAAQADLGKAMMGDKTISELAAAILSFLHERTGSPAGALFKGEGGSFRRASMLGVPDDADIPGQFALNEGLMGAGRGRWPHHGAERCAAGLSHDRLVAGTLGAAASWSSPLPRPTTWSTP